MQNTATLIPVSEMPPLRRALGKIGRIVRPKQLAICAHGVNVRARVFG
jgi:hypothetical protein